MAPDVGDFMNLKGFRSRRALFVILAVLLIVIPPLLSLPASSKSSSHLTIGGYEGVSYRRVIPTNAVTFVNYDKDSP